MKLKQFIFALVAMLSGFAFTANAQVAKVGNTEYATIDEAISNWTNGTTLTLLADVTLSDVIQLSSTEYHILDLGTYTMTAGVKKNSIFGYTYETKLDAIEIVNNARSSASYALDITADATNPGGITASGKAVVKTTGKSGVQDRPIIRFYGGVFNGSNVVSHSGSNGTNCPQFWFYGGEFNGTISANRAKFLFYGGTFNGTLSISVDSNADALVCGGKFKKLSNSYGSALNTDKFTIGSAAGVYDRGIYVDAEGYYVITSAPITEVSAKYPAVKKESYNSDNYFYYSAAATYGMFYEVASMAGTGSNVTVWEPVKAPAVEEIVKPEATEEEKAVVEEVIAEVTNNAAVKNNTVELPAEVVDFAIELAAVEVAEETTPEAPEAPVTVVTEISYTVTPSNASGEKVSKPSEPITFRLPLPSNWASEKVKVFYNGTALDGDYTVMTENGAKYVEVESQSFSTYTVKAVVPLADYVVLPAGMDASNYETMFGANTVTDGTNYYATLQAAVEAVAGQANAVLYCKPNAELGNMQHAPVVSTLTIYGNGASVAGFEHFDLGNTDKNENSGLAITGDMTLTIKNLDGFSVWGAKSTAHGVNVVIEECADMGKVFISGTTGTLNIAIEDSEFKGREKEAVYSNADGAITLTNVAFSNLNKAVNLNHKAAGTQTVTISGCSFTDCGNDVAADQIPVRVVSSVEGGKSVLSVSNSTFSGTPAGGADVLLDYGVGLTEATVASTTANVVVENENNVGTKTEVSEGNSYEFTTAKPVAEVNGTKYASLEAAVAAAQSGDEIKLIADVTLAEVVTIPAGITFNGNGKQITGTLVAAGDITFAGVTKAGDLDFAVGNTVVNIPAGASLQLNGSARMSIGFGTTFNIVGTIEDAKTADKATVVPSLVIPGASFSGAGVKFNVTNAYISVPSSYCSTSKTASGTFDFNITNSIWESAGKLAFEEQSVNAKVDFALVNSVLTTGSHLVFGTASGEEGVVIDNSYVNKDTSRQLENCGTMTIKNGSVVNGAVAENSNAKNPGTVIVENATYAVTGEFSGSDLGTGTIIIKKDATVSVGSIKAGANVTVDAEGMAAGDEINFTANLSQFTGTLSVINNDKLEAKIVDGKIVLAAKPVAKIGDTAYATLAEAVAAAEAGQTIELLADVAIDEVTVAKSITINGNGHKVTPADATKTYNSTFMVGDSGWGDNHGETITLKDIVFEGWKTNYGVVRAQGVTLAMDGCEFNGNSVSNAAYAVLSLNYTAANVANTKFVENTSRAIDVNYNADGSEAVVTVDACTFDGNTTTGAGIIYKNAGDVKVKNSTFVNNTVSTNGNAATVYTGWGDGDEVIGCTFERNTVITSHATTKRFASAIFCDGCVVNGNVFGEDNTATRNGESISTIVAVGAYYGAADLSANYWGGEMPVNGVDYTIEYTRQDVAVETYYTDAAKQTLVDMPVAKIGNKYYATLAEAVAAAENGATITLLDNVELASTLTVAGKSITLDLNGKTVSGTCNADQASLVYVENNAALTVKDSASNGKITYAKGTSGTGWTVDVKGAFTLESGTIELTGSWNIGYAVDVRPNAWGTAYTNPTVFTMNGGNIVSSDGGVRVASSSDAKHTNVSAAFVMNGGKIDAAWDGVFVQQSDAIYDELSFTMNDGIIESDLYTVRVYGPVATGYVDATDCMDINFIGGTVTYTGTDNKPTGWIIENVLIAGGGSTMETILASGNITAGAEFVNNNTLPEGYEWVADGNGNYVAASVPTDVKVATLAELQAALADNSNELPIIITAQIVIPEGTTVELDLNGKTVTVVYQEGSTTKHIYSLDNYGTLTIKDTKGNGSIKARGIFVQDGSKLTVESGSIYGIDSNGGSALYQYGGDIVINGGHIEQKAEGTYNFAINALGGTVTVNGGKIAGNHGAIAAGGATVVINDGELVCTGTAGLTDNVLYTYDNGTITINGGTFVADNDGPAGGCCVYDANGKATINGGTFSNSSGGDVWGTTGTTIKGGTFENLIEKQHIADGYELDENGTVVQVNYVAKIGETKYATLQAAIENVQEGETITVLEDITFTTGANGSTNGISYTRGASFTLDLNGKTITSNLGNNALRFKIGDGNSVVNTEVTIEIKNGKIVSGANNWCAISAATADNSGNKLILNLTDLAVEANKGGDFAVKSWAGAVVNAKNVDVTANYAGGFYAVGGEIVLDENSSVAQKGLHTAPYLSYAFGVSSGTGKMTINGGIYSAVPAATADAYNQGASHGSSVGGVMSSGGTLIINGGTFSNDNFGDAAPTAPRSLIMADAGAVVTINGGTFNAMAKIVDPTNNTGDASKNAVVTIAGGTFSANPTDAPYNIVKLAENYVAVENNGVWTVVKAVAKIGEQGYASLEDAFKAATSGCTIEIISDVIVDYYWDARNTGAKFTVPVTINGNGNTIKFTNTVYDGGNYMSAFRFEADAVVNNLTIDMSEAISGFAGRFRAISAKANLTVDGCTFIGNGYTNNTRAIIFGEGASATDLTISITNSTFNGWRRGISDNEAGKDVAATVTVTGNTLTDAGVAVSANTAVAFTGNTVSGAYVDIRSYTTGNSLNVTATGNTLEANTDKSYNYIEAGGDINAQDEFVLPTVAISYNANGDEVAAYSDFESAIAAASANTDIVRIEVVADYHQKKIANVENYYDIKTDLVIASAEENNYTLKGCGFAVRVQGNVTFTIAENLTIEGLDVVANGFATSGENMVVDGTLKAVSLKQWTSNGTITVNGKVELGYGDGQFDMAYGNGAVVVNGNGDRTVAQFKAGYSGARGNGGVLTLNDTYFEAGAWFNVNGSNTTINVNNSLLKVTGGDFVGALTLATSNVINIDINSQVVAGAISGAGTINIDADEFNGEAVTVIKADMSGFTGEINVAGEGVIKEMTAVGVVIKADPNYIAEFVMDDANSVDYTFTEEKYVGTLIYKRTLIEGIWNPLYLPFEIDVEELVENYDIAYYNQMHSYDSDNNGSFDSYEMEVARITSGTLRANYPYFIRPKSAENCYLEYVANDVTLYPALEKKIITSSVANIFTLSGTHKAMNESALAGYYAISVDGDWSATAGLKAHRLYLKIEENDNSPFATSAAKSIRIVVRGEGDGTTGVEDVTTENEVVEAIYDINGRRVLDTEKGGLYIINGKKVLVK